MRGVTVLAAAAAVWILVVGDLGISNLRMPKVRIRVIFAAVGAWLVGAIVAFGLLGTAMPAVAIGILCSAIPARIEQSRIERRISERTDRWPDLVAHMRSSVGAGATLPDAFIDAADRIGGDYAQYRDVVRHETTYGRGFEVALAHIRSELEDPIADRVLATLGIAQRTGGHRVGDVLEAIGGSVADEIRLRKAHEAALTEQRWTATVALVAPWALLSLSIATNPQAAGAFDTTEGMAVVAAGLAATGLGWLLARRASRLNVAPRLFT
ncbi:MAG: type II secretion system F family protein [Acidimicrobiia bacterium]